MAKIFESLKISARQVARKRMRVLLTALGIAIGVAAVVGTVSLGEGIRYQAVEAIKEQSDLTLIEATADIRSGTLQLITPAKIDEIAAIPHLKGSSAIVREAYATKRQTYLGVMGVDPAEIGGVIKPRFFKGEPIDPGSRQAVLGHDLAETLQRYEGIRLGDSIPILIRQYDEDGMPVDVQVDFTLVGVLQERDDQFDQMMLIDRGVAQELRGGEASFDGVLIRVDHPEEVFGVVDGVKALGLTATGAFEQIESVNRLMDVVILLLAFFAGVSLIVGALMIMNTMITSIFERTREIGITMAIGASPRDVVRLILFECLYIGLIGGVLGDLLGIAFAGVINIFGKPFIIAQLGDTFATFADAEITLITPGLLVIGILIAIVLSEVSGFYPALKAARLNPVTAIRSGE
ncbi:ABC transporter permease [Methanofollis aquaemaris]|uniref:ABC transporter permease n=1 Tax=Methanofollis aquaemaris TaxID=126734 RepID=A0A8A3S776_9EURY|nr:ABC transporter permease [Methanofollis aquaemaris]QSZ67988.1 ABC transporter permease [Methanofollis aquaemaris]